MLSEFRLMSKVPSKDQLVGVAFLHLREFFEQLEQFFPQGGLVEGGKVFF